MMSSQDFNVRISPGSPTNSCSSFSVHPSLFPPSGSSISIGTPLPVDVSQSRPPIKIHIPGPSTGPPIPPAPPSPEPLSTSFSHPTATPSHTTTVPLSMPSLLQPPSVTLKPTGLAIPSPTTCLPSEISRTQTPREKSQEEDAFPGDPVLSQASIAHVPSLITSVTITSPLQVISPITERDETEDSVGHVPGQYPYPAEDEDEDVLNAAFVQTFTLASNTPKWKKRWYQKCIELLKSNLRRGLPRRASASTPNLSSHDVCH